MKEFPLGSVFTRVTRRDEPFDLAVSGCAAAFAVTASREFFSARIGSQVYTPVWGMDLAALCLRK